jgi:hypothetical protein
MADDWRVSVELDEDENGLVLVRWLDELQLASEVRDELGERVAVSRDGPRVFLYANTESAAREGERVVRSLLDERGLAALVSISRWHPEEQRWEDPAVPLPETDAERRSEHERLEAAEAAESRRTRVAAWEVRIELDTHEQTTELAERLEREGIPVVRRWTYLLVGAANEDEARALAERIRAEAPGGARIEVEASGDIVWRVGPENPFAIFGGLAG